MNGDATANAVAGGMHDNRSTAQSVRKLLANTAALLGAYVLPRSLTFVAALVAARILGPAQFGAYSTAASFAMVVSVLATLGMQPLLIRECARRPHDAAALMRAAHMIKSVSALVMIAAAFFIASFVLQYSTAVIGAVLLLGIGYVFVGFGENYNAWFQSQERMHVWLQASILFGVINGALGIAVVAVTGSMPWFCATFAAGQLASLLWLRHRMPAADAGAASQSGALALLRAAAPFAAAFFALTLFYKLDVLLLQRLQPLDVVGRYAAGYKFVDIAQALAVVACGALYPRLARFADRADRQRASGRTLELFLLAVVPAAALLWLLRVPVVRMLFGESYAATADVLALLAPGIVLLVMNTLGWYVLSAVDSPGRLALCYSGATVMKIALGILWIPRLGAFGAALAMIATETLLAAVLLTVIARTGGGALRLRPVLLAAAAAVAAPAAAILVPAAATGLLYTFLAAGIYVYGGALENAEVRTLTAALHRAPRRVSA